MYLDPVCKKELHDEDVKAKCTYDRKTYHFCSVDCQERFVTNPAGYFGPSLWERLSKLFSAPESAETHQASTR